MNWNFQKKHVRGVFHPDDYARQTSEFAGLDVEWFGVDLEGHIGWFTSGGFAPIPSWVRVDGKMDYHRRMRGLIENTTGIATELGISSSIKGLELSVEYREQIVDMSRRGIFCYDCHSTGELDGYVRLSTPHPSLRVDMLHPDFQSELELMRLNCNFVEGDSLS